MASDRPTGPGRVALLPAVLFIADGVMAIASIPPSAGNEPVYDTVLYPLNGVILGLAGLLILSRHRGHAIGWLLTGMGLLATLTELTEGYGYHPQWPGALPIQWTSQWTSITGASATAIILMLFPDGKPATRRWRPLLALGLLSVVLSGVSDAFGHASDDAFTRGSNPYAIDSPVIGVIGVVANVGFLVSLLGGFASLIVRFRRSAAIERQQLKWVAYAMGLLALVGPFAIFFYYDSSLVRIAIALVVILLPIAICVAILRFRLYDIDRLISATIAYAAISLGLGAALSERYSSYVTAAAAGGQRADGRGPRAPRPDQARPGGERRRSPPGARRARLPGAASRRCWLAFAAVLMG